MNAPSASITRIASASATAADRLLLNGLIQPFQQPERVVRFFTRYRGQYPVTRQLLRDIANQYHVWIETRARERRIPIPPEPEGRRDDFVDRFFRRAKPDEVVVILQCSDPDRLQVLADSLTAHDLITCGQKWLRAFTPFFTAEERRDAGCQYRLFFAQTEYCDNLIFHRRAALDQLGERLLDANRTRITQDSELITCTKFPFRVA